MNYKIEVVSIEGGRDIIFHAEAKTKKIALKQAIALSKKHNKEGINSEGWLSQESVWVERDEDGDLAEHWQFINGKKVYYTSQ